MVYGISGGYGNDGEIIPLKEAVNISKTCGPLETEAGQQRERHWGV